MTAQMISPLRLVHVNKLIPGNTYLIQERRPEYQHIKFKGIFITNHYPDRPYNKTMRHFTSVIGIGNKPRSDLTLQDEYWNYYECDATVRAWTNIALREITGDSSFHI